MEDLAKKLSDILLVEVKAVNILLNVLEKGGHAPIEEIMRDFHIPRQTLYYLVNYGRRSLRSLGLAHIRHERMIANKAALLSALEQRRSLCDELIKKLD